MHYYILGHGLSRMCAQLADGAFVNGTCLGRVTVLALKLGVL